MIHVTEAAVEQVKQMKKDEGNENLMLRIGVQGGGCSGLSYSLGFDETKNEEDTIQEEESLKIVIDKESAPLLDGVVIDYKENMMGGGFTIDNPNAIVSCGCGSSFKTATNAGTPEDC